MKRPSLLKRLLSYLFPITLEVREGQFNEYLEVALSRGRYQLNSANAIYSFEDLYDNYFKTFQQLPLDKLAIEEVLILGFGMGSIPAMLEKKFNKKYRYTGVEIDEEVIHLAHKYALSELTSPIEMICADAEIFTLTCQSKYDLICIDIFLDDKIPSQFETAEYLENVAQLLNPNGIILLNRLAYTEADVIGTTKYFEEVFQRFFVKNSRFELKYNWMLMNAEK